MNEINRRYIDSKRARSERSNPTSKPNEPHPVFYNKNQEIVKTSVKEINYSRFNPGL